MRANAFFPYSEVNRLFWVMMNLKLSADLRRSVGGGLSAGGRGCGGGAVDRFGCSRCTGFNATACCTGHFLPAHLSVYDESRSLPRYVTRGNL